MELSHSSKKVIYIYIAVRSVLASDRVLPERPTRVRDSRPPATPPEHASQRCPAKAVCSIPLALGALRTSLPPFC